MKFIYYFFLYTEYKNVQYLNIVPTFKCRLFFERKYSLVDILERSFFNYSIDLINNWEKVGRNVGKHKKILMA